MAPRPVIFVIMCLSNSIVSTYDLNPIAGRRSGQGHSPIAGRHRLPAARLSRNHIPGGESILRWVLHQPNRIMDASIKWGPLRYATLLVVLTLHLALFAALMMKSRVPSISASTQQSVQLLLLPPATVPKMRSENAHPGGMTGEAIKIAPPVLKSPTTSTSPAPASSSDGNGSGVDWTAEARRALSAFEIRSHQTPYKNSVSGKPGEDNWWPQGVHHAGDQFKTANGDWIVWINANCYQVASSAPNGPAPSVSLPQTVCRGRSNAVAR